jgi:hypothetical protein
MFKGFEWQELRQGESAYITLVIRFSPPCRHKAPELQLWAEQKDEPLRKLGGAKNHVTWLATTYQPERQPNADGRCRA